MVDERDAEGGLYSALRLELRRECQQSCCVRHVTDASRACAPVGAGPGSRVTDASRLVGVTACDLWSDCARTLQAQAKGNSY